MKICDGRWQIDYEPEGPWEKAEWDTYRYAASLTFRERLIWLEQASHLAVKMQKAKKLPLPRKP